MVTVTNEQMKGNKHMRDIKKEVNKCIRELQAIGYDVPPITEIKVSGHMTRTFGQCTTRKSDTKYTKLTFAKFLADEKYPENDMKNTIIHELLHAIDRNTNGHNGRWSAMARDVSAKLPYGRIQQYCDNDKVKNRNMVKPMKRYAIRCKCCGKVTAVKGYRAPKWYTHVENYRCGLCNGTFEKC